MNDALLSPADDVFLGDICADDGSQGYELAEDELTISLDRFKMEYTSADGSVKYVHL